MKKNQKIAVVALLVVIAAAGGLLYAFSPEPGPVAAYETVVAERGTISNSVTATGTIEPITEVEVGTQVSGKITKIYVDYNSVVRQGQLLAELDTVELRATLDSRQASLEAARIKYEYELKNYGRIKGLYEKGMVSQTDYEDAAYEYETSKTSYDQAKSNMVQAETNLGYARIFSPIDGVVLSREIEQGQTVAASFETPTLFTIAQDLSKMRVIADVDEADIGQVKEGQLVDFTVDAFPEDVFKGSVTQVRLQATTESNVVTYEVVIDAPNPDLKLMPGLTANITVFTLQKPDVLVVPTKALRFSPSGEKQAATAPRRLWVQNSGQLKEVLVKVGVTDGIYTEVTEGVKEGEAVVVGLQASVPVAGDGDSAEGTSPFMPTPPGGKKK